jgi:hypothetical protein
MKYNVSYWFSGEIYWVNGKNKLMYGERLVDHLYILDKISQLVIFTFIGNGNTIGQIM